MKLFLKHTCPCCGSKVYVTNKGYHCSNCNFFVKGYICNRHISIDDAEAILNGEHIILDGFSTDNGKIFSSIPVVHDNTVVLDNTVFRCDTSYGIGRVIVGRRFFKCERSFVCNQECPFTKNSHFRRSIDGHMITVKDIVDLLTSGRLLIQTYSDTGNVTHKLFLYPVKCNTIAHR